MTNKANAKSTLRYFLIFVLFSSLHNINNAQQSSTVSCGTTDDCLNNGLIEKMCEGGQCNLIACQRDADCNKIQANIYACVGTECAVACRDEAFCERHLPAFKKANGELFASPSFDIKLTCSAKYRSCSILVAQGGPPKRPSTPSPRPPDLAPSSEEGSVIMIYPRIYTRQGDECVTRWKNRRGEVQRACTTDSLRGGRGRKSPWCATATDRDNNPTAIGDCFAMTNCKYSSGYKQCRSFKYKGKKFPRGSCTYLNAPDRRPWCAIAPAFRAKLFREKYRGRRWDFCTCERLSASEFSQEQIHSLPVVDK